MKLWLVLFLIVRAAYSAGVADIISSYAKVTVNDGTKHIENSTEINSNETDLDEDGSGDYDDFDDQTEVSVRGQSNDNMLKYISGFVNLLALMYKFSGNAKPRPPINQPRNADDSLSNSINQMAEERYHPQTETKKFKAEGYPPLNSYTYNAMGSNAAETYANSGKTSYDADASQYMPDKTPDKMKDYMNQNDIDIQQSYSYEIPQKDNSWNDVAQKPVAPVYYPWMSKTTTRPPPIEEYQKPEPKKKFNPWMGKPVPAEAASWGDEKPIEMYPWMTHDNHDEEIMAKPHKSKPPPPDDNVYPYPYSHDHDIAYHDDHQEEDHQIMKDEDRESKRPYTYYHLGRKLWYVPLLFSMYFIVYIASLILKSVARHKVQFPEKLWELNDHHHHHGDHHRRSRKLDEVTENVYKSLDNKYM